MLPVAIGFIILSTARWKLNVFLALLLTAYGVGPAARMPIKDIATNINAGFGGLMMSIGLVIILGTIIGVCLEKSRAAVGMAETVLRVVGEKRPGLAMNNIGYIVSIPCSAHSRPPGGGSGGTGQPEAAARLGLLCAHCGAILLIALASVANFPSKPFGDGALKCSSSSLARRVTALLIGVGFALLLVKKLDERMLSGWVGEALKASATITGAGGSLGKRSWRRRP